MRKRVARSFHRTLPQRASILDIGCGFGEPFARYVIDRGFGVEGVDASDLALGGHCVAASVKAKSQRGRQIRTAATD
jgi:2-polyprenyl-3-methyl-5-hydroxy-6-metoxy-1,4-benzoquinol methylase